MKSRRTRWAENVARKGRKNTYMGLVGKTEGKRQVGNQDVGGRIILKWILEI
jgi:hypothetical protein